MEWIWIVLLIGISVVNGIRKNKKKQEAEKNAPQHVTRPESGSMQPSATGHPSTSRAELSKEGGVSAPPKARTRAAMVEEQRRRAQGLKTSGLNMHMIFAGNPGTGKTTIATLEADCGISGQSRRSTDCSAPGRPPSEPAGQGGGRTCASSAAIYPLSAAKSDSGNGGRTICPSFCGRNGCGTVPAAPIRSGLETGSTSW